jgi:hypothetical protein
VLYKVFGAYAFILAKFSKSDILKEAQEKYGGYTGKDMAIISKKRGDTYERS